MEERQAMHPDEGLRSLGFLGLSVLGIAAVSLLMKFARSRHHRAKSDGNELVPTVRGGEALEVSDELLPLRRHLVESLKDALERYRRGEEYIGFVSDAATRDVRLNWDRTTPDENMKQAWNFADGFGDAHSHHRPTCYGRSWAEAERAFAEIIERIEAELPVSPELRGRGGDF